MPPGQAPLRYVWQVVVLAAMGWVIYDAFLAQ